MRNPLIEVNPITRQKGYEPNPVQIRKFSEINQQTQKNIRADLADLTAEQTGNQEKTWSDQNIFNIYLAAYQKLERAEALDGDEFVLSGHELLEYASMPADAKGRYLVYRYRYNKFPENKITEAYPPCLQIEPTSVCNFRCIMCFQTDPTFNKKATGFMGNMRLETFKEIVDQAEGNIEAITLASRGEPLLNKALPEMLKYSEGKFIGLKLNTNASLLNEKLSHMLLSSDIKNLVFSIDSGDKETYETIRVNGKFDQVMKKLEQFAEIRSKHYGDKKLVCKVSGVRLGSAQSPEELHKVWGGFVDSVEFVNYSPWESTYSNEINEIKSPCTDLWRRMFVWWDGTVNPCDVDYKSTLSLWNIKDSELSQIWTSAPYNDLRQKHLNQQRRNLEPCARCITT